LFNLAILIGMGNYKAGDTGEEPGEGA
jgi:hypothetical protein